jgi:hypothetical protein
MFRGNTSFNEDPYIGLPQVKLIVSGSLPGPENTGYDLPGFTGMLPSSGYLNLFDLLLFRQALLTVMDRFVSM